MSLVRNLPQYMSLVPAIVYVLFCELGSHTRQLEVDLNMVRLAVLLLYHGFCYAIGHDDVTVTKLMEIAGLIVVSLIFHEERVVSRHSVMTDETVQQMSVFVSPKRTGTN